LRLKEEKTLRDKILAGLFALALTATAGTAQSAFAEGHGVKHKVKKAAVEVGDKTEDGWDKTKKVSKKTAHVTKKGAVEVGDKTEDAWDQTKKYSKKTGHVVKKGAIEVGDKTEDGWDKTKKFTKKVKDKLD
jgi:hypothetical protein